MKIRHARIAVDAYDGQYHIAGRSFKSLAEFVDTFQATPIYENTTLTTIATKNLAEILDSKKLPVRLISGYSYYLTHPNKVTCYNLQ